jgi:polyisoprenoid-binding protein YceI
LSHSGNSIFPENDLFYQAGVAILQAEKEIMMTSKNLARSTVFTAALLLGGNSARASDWEIDSAHSAAQFTVRHLMVSNVRGQFDNLSGTVVLDDKEPTKSRVEVTIDAATINTRNPKRDAHLKTPDFFDVANHPKITFKSTRIEKTSDTQFKVTGDLTMRGVTHPVTLAVEGPTPALKNPFGQTVRGLNATGKLSRKQWGLNWNKALEAGGVVVGDEVQIQIDAELVAKGPRSATSAALAK